MVLCLLPSSPPHLCSLSLEASSHYSLEFSSNVTSPLWTLLGTPLPTHWQQEFWSVASRSCWLVLAHSCTLSSTKTRVVVFITIPQQLGQNQHIAATHKTVVE